MAACDLEKNVPARNNALEQLAVIAPGVWTVDMEPSANVVRSQVPSEHHDQFYTIMWNNWLGTLPSQLGASLQDKSMKDKFQRVAYSRVIVFKVCDQTAPGSPTFSINNGHVYITAHPSSVTPSTKLHLEKATLDSAIDMAFASLPTVSHCPLAGEYYQPAMCGQCGVVTVCHHCGNVTDCTHNGPIKCATSNCTSHSGGVPSLCPHGGYATTCPNSGVQLCPSDHDISMQARDKALKDLEMLIGTGAWSTGFLPAGEVIRSSCRSDMQPKFYSIVWGSWLAHLPTQLAAAFSDSTVKSNFINSTKRRHVDIRSDVSGNRGVLLSLDNGALVISAHPESFSTSTVLDVSPMQVAFLVDKHSKSVPVSYGHPSAPMGAHQAHPIQGTMPHSGPLAGGVHRPMPAGMKLGDPVFYKDSRWAVRSRASDGNVYFISNGVAYKLVDEEGWNDCCDTGPKVKFGGINHNGDPQFYAANDMHVTGDSQTAERKLICEELYKQHNIKAADTMRAHDHAHYHTHVMRTDNHGSHRAIGENYCNHCEGRGMRFKNHHNRREGETCSTCKGTGRRGEARDLRKSLSSS